MERKFPHIICPTVGKPQEFHAIAPFEFFCDLTNLKLSNSILQFAFLPWSALPAAYAVFLITFNRLYW